MRDGRALRLSLDDVRLLALDVDGTLIDDQFRLLPRTRALLTWLVREAGKKVCLCSGRNPAGVMPYMEMIRGEGPLVVHNGAFNFYHPKGDMYALYGYPVEDFLEVIETLERRRLPFDVNTPYDLYVREVRPELAPLYAAYFAEPKVIANWRDLRDPIVKLSVLVPPEELDAVHAELAERFGDRFRVVKSGETYIDFVHPEANKGNGLRSALQELGLSPNQVIAVGNYYNDLEMLSLAGVGVAMGNSPPEVKECVDYVTLSNNEEGVYVALVDLLFGGRLPRDVALDLERLLRETPKRARGERASGALGG